MALSHLLDTTPPRLLTVAACGGLEPAPDSRLRGTYPHLLHSIAPPFVSAFVAHDRRHIARRLCRLGPPAVSSAQPASRSSNVGRYWQGAVKSPNLGRFPCHRPSRSRLRGCPPAAISGSGG